MSDQDRTDGPDELAEAIAWFQCKGPKVLTPRYLVHDALTHAATIVRAVLAAAADDNAASDSPRTMALIGRVFDTLASRQASRSDTTEESR